MGSQVKVNEIGVIAKDGVVTLTGWVDSYIKRWRAEEAAHRVGGVRAVANDIEIRLASERTDPDIAAAAIRALEWNSSVPAHKLKVTVSKGWVTLEAGRVAIPEGRRRTCCAAVVGRQRSKQPDLCTTLGHTIGTQETD
jgi:osmotically-inducible protein OsmY